jgi:hypothetical protein
MKRRYVLAPEAALDLVQIWCHLKAAAYKEASFFPKLKTH